MRMKKIWCLACILLLSLWAIGNLEAQSTEEERLEKIQADLDQDAGSESQAAREEVLLAQFKDATQMEIEALRNANRGWGEITIQLSLAEKLWQARPEEYASFEEALDHVGALRDEGLGWGNVSKELDVSDNLGEVVNKADRARQSFEEAAGGRTKTQEVDRTKARRENAVRTESKRTKVERIPKVQRVEHVEKPERPIRPERPLRPERPERPNH